MPDHYVLHIAKWYPNIEDDLEGIFIQRHVESTHLHYNSVVFYARASAIPINKGWYITIEEHSGPNYTLKDTISEESLELEFWIKE